MALTEGGRVGHYEVLNRLGSGGMGTVYRARDTQLDRMVALKVVRDGDQHDPAAQARLLREARTASSLNHPNIATIYVAGRESGFTYIAMELVDGSTLEELIPHKGLPTEEVIRYGVEIASALSLAHQNGIIHRDLKCANVMLARSGAVKVLDFGIARRLVASESMTLTQETLSFPGSLIGTVAYMAPELIEGHPADAISDLWSLGVVLYHALSGSLPFEGATTLALFLEIQRADPPPLPGSVPSPVSAIVGRLLERDRKERFQSADEVRAALQGLLAIPHAHMATRRRWLWAGAAGAAVAVGGGWWLTRGGGVERRLIDGAKPSRVPEANEYYERAVMFAGIAMRHDAKQYRRMLERALELDPQFSAARAQYAFSRILMLVQGESVDSGLIYEAEDGCRRALREDPGCGFAHATLAGAAYLRGQKDRLLLEYRQARRLGHDDPVLHTWLMLFHTANGDYETVEKEARQTIDRWPLFWPARMNLSEAHRQQGDLEGALRLQDPLLEQDQQNAMVLHYRARIYLDAGRLSEARSTLEGLSPESRRNCRVRFIWAFLLALEGDRAGALREIDKDALAFAGLSFFGPMHAAEHFALTREPDQAFEWLDRASRMGDDRDTWLKQNPLLASIRQDARFGRFVESAAYRRRQRPPWEGSPARKDSHPPMVR